MEEALKNLGYYSNKLKEEITRINENNFELMKRHFRKAAVSSSEQCGMVLLPYIIFIIVSLI